MVTFKSRVKSKLYIKPYGSVSYDFHKIFIHSDFDERALSTIPVILENKIVKFVPLSNLEYNVEVKLLNDEKEFYKFF